jgi:hypothetical protein
MWRPDWPQDRHPVGFWATPISSPGGQLTGRLAAGYITDGPPKRAMPNADEGRPACPTLPRRAAPMAPLALLRGLLPCLCACGDIVIGGALERVAVSFHKIKCELLGVYLGLDPAG